jgi:hypothetical protein
VSAGGTKGIATVTTEISAEGSDVVVTQTDSAISEPLSGEAERVRTVVISKKADGAVISERTATSVITEEAEYNIAAVERSERIRKLGLLDRPIDRPGLEKRLLAGGRLLRHERQFLAELVAGRSRPAQRPRSVGTVLKNDWIAEVYLWLEASRPDLQKGQIERVVARHYRVSTRHVREVMRSLSPQRRRAFEKDIADHGPRSSAALEAK